MKSKTCAIYSGSKDEVEKWIQALLKKEKKFSTPVPSTCVVGDKLVFNVVIIYE